MHYLRRLLGACLIAAFCIAPNASAAPPPPAQTRTHAHITQPAPQRGQPWPGAAYQTGAAPLRVQPDLAPPSGVDLDVTFIQRTPAYWAYCVQYPNGVPELCPGTAGEQRWPAPSELVTFTAHVINKGTIASPAFAYTWSVDGVAVASGSSSTTLVAGAERTFTYQWPWAHTLSGERLLGDHTVRFAVDTGNAIVETFETNNSLEDRTNALSLEIGITPAMYAKYNTPFDPEFSFSAEDWLQRQVAAMNESLANSIYEGTSPAGATERVRINNIAVTSSSPVNRGSSDGGWFVTGDYRETSSYYDPFADVDWGFVRELSRQIGLVDLSNLNIDAASVLAVDGFGQGANMEFTWPRADLMGGGDIDPNTDWRLYSSHSAAGISTTKGYRRGYAGEYQYDIPQQNTLLLRDSSGQPAPNVEVALFQRTTSTASGWVVDNTPEITGMTNASGLFVLPNRPVSRPVTTATGHTLAANPFGNIDLGSGQNLFLVRLRTPAHEEFFWLNSTVFNLAYWRGNTGSYTFDLATHVPPPGAPSRPVVRVPLIEGEQKTVCWSPVTGATGYRVYRTTVTDYTYYDASDLVTATCWTEFSGATGLYTVVAVDGSNRQSGFSQLAWGPSLVNPSAVGVYEDGTRVVLDPQNGLSLLRQAADGRYIRSLRGAGNGLEYSLYLTVDRGGRLLISHPGDMGANRHSVRVADADGQLLLEFGEQGSGNAQFQAPAGVAGWGVPCTPGGGCSYRILVADAGNNRLQVFDGAGVFQSAFGGPGSGPGQFNNPQGLAVTEDGRVLVADTGNSRIQVFTFNGTAFQLVRSLTGFSSVLNVAGGPKGEIIATDAGQGRVSVYSSQGALLGAYTGPNDEYTGAFEIPRSAVADPAGRLIVSDIYMMRVATVRNVFAAPPLTAGKATGGVVLQWKSAGTGTQSYRVWRASNSPYFTPGPGGSQQVGSDLSPATLTITDGGSGLGNPDTNSFYVLQAFQAGGWNSTSTRTGEFDFRLTPGR